MVHANSADAHAPDATAIEGLAVGTVITRRGVLALIINSQMTTTATASGQPLQKRRTFSNNASALLGTGGAVGSQTGLVHFKSGPANEAGMVIADENGPLVHWQKPRSFADASGFIDVAFTAAFTIGVSPCIDGIAQDRMDGDVSGLDPKDLSIGTLVREE